MKILVPLPSVLYKTPFHSLKHGWIANELNFVGGQHKILSCVGGHPEKFVWKCKKYKVCFIVFLTNIISLLIYQSFIMIEVTLYLVNVRVIPKPCLIGIKVIQIPLREILNFFCWSHYGEVSWRVFELKCENTHCCTNSIHFLMNA